MNKKQINDDPKLLKEMIRDSMGCKSIYQPGPYWENQTHSSVRELKRQGLADFRSGSNGIATSYGDNLFVDTRASYNFGARRLLRFTAQRMYPINRLFETQVKLTKSYALDLLLYKNEYLRNHPRVLELLKKYKISFDTTKGSCLSFMVVDGKKISHHYLELLSTLDHVSRNVPINAQTRFMEIGGGFGANVHLLVELFGIRKILYLDISPNLYVGTQYLKSFYGKNVKDYLATKGKPIAFKKNFELEIICILPHQIEYAQLKIDFFHNAHSFVEMPRAVIKNYAGFIKKLSATEAGYISLVSYDNYNPQTTLNPDDLPLFFEKPFQKFTVETLKPGRKNFHYVISP